MPHRRVEIFFANNTDDADVLRELVKEMGGAAFCRIFTFPKDRNGLWGSTLLHRAACSTSTLHLQVLLEQDGAPINFKDPYGFTPLHRLCGSVSLDIPKPDTPEIRAVLTACLKLLAGAGADIDAISGKDVGHTPLQYALDQINCGVTCYEDLLNELVALGADCNSKDPSGNSALILAARAGQIQLIPLLLDEKGLDINHQNKVLETALFQATPEVMSLLLRRGADMAITSCYGERAIESFYGLRIGEDGYQQRLVVWEEEVQRR